MLDNTYLTRASRSHVLEAAGRHGLPVRCVWLDTPLAQAQVNLVERLLDRFERLPTPEELRAAARREAGVHTPTSQMRTLRELEPPAADEGFGEVEQVPFERASRVGRAGLFVAAAASDGRAGSRLGRADARLRLAAGRRARGAPHGAARRPRSPSARTRRRRRPAGAVHPCPGLPLAFARAHGVDPARSLLVGTGTAHKTLAAALGARYVQV